MIDENRYIIYCYNNRVIAHDKLRRTNVSYPRVIMEDYLGRKLQNDEQVHHIDGNPLNNDISNLKVMNKKEHLQYHNNVLHCQNKYFDKDMICPVCGKSFLWTAKQQNYFRSNKHTAEKEGKQKFGPFCSIDCQIAFTKTRPQPKHRKKRNDKTTKIVKRINNIDDSQNNFSQKKENSKRCDICGVTENEKPIYTIKGMYLCPKHKGQYYRHGKITDLTKRTTNDKNEIVIYNDHAEIIITNKSNTKTCNAIIDLDDVDRIKIHKWRIEGNYVKSGRKTNKIWLHRFIMNYNGPLDVDHINRNPLDNRKINLRIVTFIENQHNRNIGSNNIKTNGKTYTVELTRYKIKFHIGKLKTKEEAELAKEKLLKYIEDNKNQFILEYKLKNKYLTYYKYMNVTNLFT